MRQTILLAAAAVFLFVVPATADASQARCSELFPGVDWTSVEAVGPMTVATAGLNDATSERFAEDVGSVATQVQGDIGGLDGAAVCLAAPELAGAFSDFAPFGQRLHAAAFGEDRTLLIAAVEPRMVDDAIAFGIPQVALWQLSQDLGLDDGYPEPLGTTIAHWYLATYTDRLALYESLITVEVYLDDPQPEDRTPDEAISWVGGSTRDPLVFDPARLDTQTGAFSNVATLAGGGPQMSVFIDFVVEEEGPETLQAIDQATWADLEKRWRIAIRDEFPRGNFGVHWGWAIVIGFTSLAALLAWLRRLEKRRLAQRRPTPPPDESLYVSSKESEVGQ